MYKSKITGRYVAERVEDLSRPEMRDQAEADRRAEERDKEGFFSGFEAVEEPTGVRASTDSFLEGIAKYEEERRKTVEDGRQVWWEK